MKPDLNQFYGNYDENGRLLTRAGHVEFTTTMHFIEKYLTPGARILEVGAATGRYSHTLARMGYRVDAVELVEYNIKIFNETFAGERTICYYPFGLCSRKQKGKIIDLEWKKTFITKAKTYHRDIIPTHISGRNSDFFYNLSNIRKKLGIKVNIEMLFLVNEFYKQKNKTLTISFGKPIPWQTFDNRYTDSEWAMKLRNFSYNLPGNCEQEFDPEKNYTI